MSFRTKSGFTIVELLIVIVVIAILATIGIVSFTGIRQRAEAAAIEQGLVDTKKLMEVQKITNNETYTPAMFESYLNKEDQLAFTQFRYGTPTSYCLDSQSKSTGTVTNHSTNTSAVNTGACPTTTSSSSAVCISGNVTLTIRQQNDLPEPANITISTPSYGSGTTTTPVSPGVNHTRAFTTRLPSIVREVVTITLVSASETSIRYLAVPPRTC